MGGGMGGTAGLKHEIHQRRAIPLVHMELLAQAKKERSRAEDEHKSEVEAHEALDSELAAVHAEIAAHHREARRPRKATGAFGALAGDDLTEAAAHATASAAPALSSVPERGGGYHRPRKAT
eukprot:COSAG02_NODE_5370_length_4393_cov_4.246390_1_plen_122_part_00